MKSLGIILLSIIVMAGYCHAQQGLVRGIVVNEQGEALPGVSIYLQNSSHSTVSDLQGHFLFARLKSGSYSLRASYIGFQPFEQLFSLDADNAEQEIILEIKLIEQTRHLNEVEVTGQSKATLLREAPQSVSVLETRSLYGQSTNTSDVISRISGVRVRQSGGLGSQANFMVNGMSGKQLKFFLDGIPLSYFGNGMNLQVLPVNMMERIEVYKGVVPVELGADALGGAVNIISRKAEGSYLDAAYSVASFNTHKVNINTQYQPDGKAWFVGMNSFYNRSDNNYKVDVEIPNRFGNPEPATVRRFHDRYQNYLVNLYSGIRETKWADQFRVQAMASGLDDEIQHNVVMAQPYGQVHYQEKSRGLALDYKKEKLLKNLDISWFAAYNRSEGLFTDTTLNAYTWDGQVSRRRTDGGEISTSRNLLQMQSNNVLSRFFLRYYTGNHGQLSFNMFSSRFHRVGEDPVAAEFYGQDFYQNPTVLFKNAAGLAYEHHFFNEKLSTYTALKHFTFAAEGYAIQGMDYQPHAQKVSKGGFSQAFRYRLLKNWLAKTSYEYATRLPDEYELFGDFALVRPNPSLQAEVSHNLNVGLQYKQKRFQAEVQGFYRNTDQAIWLRSSQFYAQYQNLLKAEVRGVEAEIAWQPLKSLQLNLNATYQDIRNKSAKENTGVVDNRYFNARLPNIPYLFGNSSLSYRINDFYRVGRPLDLWWRGSYVHDFFLYWANDGRRDLKNVIPRQFIQQIGISYPWLGENLMTSFEVHNLFDRQAFDNFNVQRPGRSFHLTFRTFLNNL